MPDPELELPFAKASGQWGPVPVTGPGRLRLTSDGLALEAPGLSLQVRYAELGGGGWRTGAISIHAGGNSATIESARGLQDAWVTLLARACPLPELARSHRLLGSRRGGSPDAQVRFMAPLVQARRRLEDGPDLDARVAALDARALRDRIDLALQGIAKDSVPANLPDRRALEAELEEAMGTLFARLDALDLSAQAFRNAAEPVRFSAWRDWVAAVSNVFAAADSGWSGVARLLPEPR
jgi:hypothetical protein